MDAPGVCEDASPYEILQAMSLGDPDHEYCSECMCVCQGLNVHGHGDYLSDCCCSIVWRNGNEVPTWT